MRSPTCTSLPASRCVTAHRSLRRWSSVPPPSTSLRSRSLTGTASTVRCASSRPATRPASHRCSASTWPSCPRRRRARRHTRRAARGCVPSRCAVAPRSTPATPGSPSSPGADPGRLAPGEDGGPGEVDPRHPRVTVLARGQASGVGPGVGWARLCRLVTQTHLSGERGCPVSTLDLLVEHATDPRGGPAALVVLLGPQSDVGLALLQRRPDLARALLRRWTDQMPRGSVVIEAVCHGGPEGSPASAGHAGRLLGLATEAGLPVILSAAVRHADPDDARTVDVLDAARRLVPLDTRHLDRVTTAAHLASTPRMHAVACEVVRAAGAGVTGGSGAERERARQLMADTVALARQCAQDSRTDLGIGGVHLPEPAVLGIGAGEDPQQVLAARCRGAVATRYAGATPG